MADQLLSQADVDALVASLTRNDLPKPAAPVQAKPAGPAPVPAQVKPAPVNAAPKPAGPAVAKPAAASPAAAASRPAPVRQEPKAEVNSESVNSLNARISDLSRQISQIGTAFKRLEILEKKIAEVEARSKSNGIEITEQKVRLLGDEIKKISLNLKGTPGYGIKNSFNCEKCSDHGHVAVMFRCTKCGHERWYGWWPE